MSETSISNLFQKQKDFLRFQSPLSYEHRLNNLKTLEKMILENETEILSALSADLNKPETEAWCSEIGTCLEELRIAKKNLHKWMKPKKIKTPLLLFPAKVYQHAEPLGCILIIAPWNYPFQLAITPLIGALAAGNTAILKSSEVTPSVSALLAKLIGDHFPPEQVALVQGAIPESTALLKLPFDHIFFTGNPSVGKIVMRAASENLCPVTLELGGKSPVIVTADADLDLAARRIIWGKTFNAGQTCVAPDYLYVDRRIQNTLIEKLKLEIQKQWPALNDNYSKFTKIVSSQHFIRLNRLLENQKIVYGGSSRSADRYIEPTLTEVTDFTSPIMQEEIFGPLLPIIEFDSVTEALEQIRIRPKPLTAYIFSNDSNAVQDFTRKISAGGIAVNDVVIQFSNPNIGFGGVGMSGMGSYHGHRSFLCFSHLKGVTYKSRYFDLPIRYAPYTSFKLNLMKKIFKMP